MSLLQGSRLLYHVASKKPLEDDENEDLRSIELYIDETYNLSHKDVIERHFLDFLRELHTVLLAQEQEKKLSSIAPDSPEYLEVYMQIMQKSQKLGIIPGKITL